MNFIYVGDLVNTHGIKGEVRILSDFELKDQVFVKGFKLYIGRNHEEEVIKTYRKHKNFDMVTLEEIDDINDVLGYKGDRVYVNRDELVIKDYILQDLIGLDVYDQDKLIGPVKQVMKSKAHDILVVSGETKNHMIPRVDEFLKEVNLKDKKILINNIEGLIDEN
jgi:16S rRNA processing protein RimM